MKTPEQKVVDEVVQAAEGYDILCLPIEVRGARGWPDYLFVYEGRYVWVEFKRAGKKPRKLQEVRLRTLAKHGAEAYYFDNAADALRKLCNEFF